MNGLNKEPRLRFTDEERADPALEKPIRKADKAAAKADKAQAKIPKKQVRQKTVDPETGKVTTKLVMEDKKKPPSKLSHAVRDTPANAALGKIHKEIRETEQDNVGVAMRCGIPPPMPPWGKFTRKSGRPNRTMWAWRAPISPRRLPRPAHG